MAEEFNYTPTTSQTTTAMTSHGFDDDEVTNAGDITIGSGFTGFSDLKSTITNWSKTGDSCSEGVCGGGDDDKTKDDDDKVGGGILGGGLLGASPQQPPQLRPRSSRSLATGLAYDFAAVDHSFFNKSSSDRSFFNKGSSNSGSQKSITTTSPLLPEEEVAEVVETAPQDFPIDEETIEIGSTAATTGGETAATSDIFYFTNDRNSLLRPASTPVSGFGTASNSSPTSVTDVDAAAAAAVAAILAKVDKEDDTTTTDDVNDAKKTTPPRNNNGNEKKSPQNSPRQQPKPQEELQNQQQKQSGSRNNSFGATAVRFFGGFGRRFSGGEKSPQRGEVDSSTQQGGAAESMVPPATIAQNPLPMPSSANTFATPDPTYSPMPYRHDQQHPEQSPNSMAVLVDNATEVGPAQPQKQLSLSQLVTPPRRNTGHQYHDLDENMSVSLASKLPPTYPRNKSTPDKNGDTTGNDDSSSGSSNGIDGATHHTSKAVASTITANNYIKNSSKGNNNQNNNAAIGTPAVDETSPSSSTTTSRCSDSIKNRVIALLTILCLGLATYIVIMTMKYNNTSLSLFKKRKYGDMDDDFFSNDMRNATPPLGLSSGTLRMILQRGYLRCGVRIDNFGFAYWDEAKGRYQGFDADLCRAVSAAIFGKDGHVEFYHLDGYERFTALQTGQVDMLARLTTYTMERDLHEPSSGAGVSFSTPYLYSGLQFAGKPEHVQCAENFSNEGSVCSETVICVADGSTHIGVIQAKYPNASIATEPGLRDMYEHFASGFCNVIAAEQFDLAESVVRDQSGYKGEYAIGNNVHSKEPFALVTRDDDVIWSDFVNWVMQTLIAAEDEGITSDVAHLIPLRSEAFFGDEFSSMFRDVVSVVGNYGEIYERNLEHILPRPVSDYINDGKTGLIYAFPFGNLNAVGPDPIARGRLQKILLRGKLQCGVQERRPIYAVKDTNGEWSGFDIDFCKAIAAAIFGDVDSPEKYIEYVEIDTGEQDGTSEGSDNVFLKEAIQAFQSERIDILARSTPISLIDDLARAVTKDDGEETSWGVGLTFSQPILYDGLTFGGLPPYDECADRLDFGSTVCRSLRVCVLKGSSYEAMLRLLIPEPFIVLVDDKADDSSDSAPAVDGLRRGDCNAIVGSLSSVAKATVLKQDKGDMRTESGYSIDTYQVGINRFSRIPLGLITRDDDDQWSKFVYWIVMALFYAEEQGISQETQSSGEKMMPLVYLFGTNNKFGPMFRRAVNAVGSYKDIYKRNVESNIPRASINQLNTQLQHPQHYPLPGVI